MSRAFTKELDDQPADVGERPVSPHRNLVTSNGLRLIEAELARLQQELQQAKQAGETSLIAQLARDIRYWVARRETAELVSATSESTVVRFGMRVTIESEDGRKQQWALVGEDEADPAKGSISHISPLAVALFGKEKGDLITVNGRELEIIDFAPLTENNPA